MKKLTVLCAAAVMALSLGGCRQASRVNYNLSKSADNFNVTRRLSVINTRTDEPLFEMVGNFAISNDDENELVVTVETCGEAALNQRWKALVERGAAAELSLVSDCKKETNVWSLVRRSGAYVDKYHYEVNFLPEMIIPITFTSDD